jgi:gluconate 5-dehydrogenase
MDTAEWILDGKRILVTGASSGLGLAMSKALLAAGAEVALASRSAKKLNEVYGELKNQGHRAHMLVLDVRSEDSVNSAVSWVEEKWGELDMLVNNAGIGMITVNPHFLTQPLPFFDVPPSKFKDFLDTNIFGYFLVSAEFAKLFLEGTKRSGAKHLGRIVNISVNKETMTRRGFIPYGPSRAASEAMSYVMAEDLKPYKVAVNILLPGGATMTGMIPSRTSDEIKRRLLDPTVMARPITFLASDEAEGLTGQLIVATDFDSWLSKFRAPRPRDHLA